MKKGVEILHKAGRYLLYLVIFFLLGIANVMIKILSFKRLLRLLTNAENEYIEKIDQKRIDRINLIGRSISKISYYTPWRSMCFEQAIVASVLLRIIGVSNNIFFGIRKNEIDQLEAHAWTKVDDIYVTGGGNKDQFNPVLIRSYIRKKSEV